MSWWFDLIQSSRISEQGNELEELKAKVEHLQQVVQIQQEWIEYLNKRLLSLGDDGK